MLLNLILTYLALLILIQQCDAFSLPMCHSLHHKKSFSSSSLVMRERKCDISGSRRNSKCMAVSKSNSHSHKVQNVNLQTRKLWWAEGLRLVKVRIAVSTYRTILKNGLHATALKYGVDLRRFSVSYGVAPGSTANHVRYGVPLPGNETATTVSVATANAVVVEPMSMP